MMTPHMWSNWTIRWLVRTKNYTLASSFWGFENNHELLLLTDMWLASHKCMKTKPGFYPIQTYLNETFHHQFEITLPSNVWKCCWVWYKFALAYCMGEWKLLLYYQQKTTEVLRKDYLFSDQHFFWICDNVHRHSSIIHLFCFISLKVG